MDAADVIGYQGAAAQCQVTQVQVKEPTDVERVSELLKKCSDMAGRLRERAFSLHLPEDTPPTPSTQESSVCDGSVGSGLIGEVKALLDTLREADNALRCFV
uniref:Uncharacterized protein n=1 Tax=viral metagenome TaxID=1070528 RepID=A0A6M3LJS9_9ZZZZ